MKGKYDHIEINQFITSSTGLRPHNLTEAKDPDSENRAHSWPHLLLGNYESRP